MSTSLFLKYTAILSGIFITITNAAPLYAKNKKSSEKDTSATQPASWQVDTLIRPVPNNRALIVDKVNRELRAADARDGEVDGNIYADDSVVSQILTKAILRQAYLTHVHVENLDIVSNEKIRYHSALYHLLRKFNTDQAYISNAVYYKKLVDNFEKLVIARAENNLMDFVEENKDIYTMENVDLLDGYPEAKAKVFEQVGRERPEMMIKRLPEFAKESYADPIVAAAAKVTPGTILNYATSTSSLSGVVRRNQDPLVQAIVKIATESNAPLNALPFLGDIYNKRKTIAEIDAYSKNSDDYYKNLVRLKLEKETIAQKSIDEELNYRGLKYVRVVNELHDEKEAVRFKSIENFNAPELYFMMIGGQNEIYTSSYTGMFKRMLAKMGTQTGDQLLDTVHYDHFRTFIRLSAGYNTLSPFLATMSEEKKFSLMRDFVANLEQGRADDLDDAVDVADAFGSITDATLIDFLKSEVKANYERVYKENNRYSEKGIILYGLLGTIFNNAENISQIVPGVPPITYVSNASLTDSSGRVIQQVFFYGDEDGKTSYVSFLSSFRNNKWKIDESNKQWITITSQNSKPVTIYANRPLAEPKDEEAQKALKEYMEQKGIRPTAVIHRGHSYHLSSSLKDITPNVKIVMLGSCGGYHNLSQVLDNSPDANIISTKQTGAMKVNEPIIRAINERLLAGKDVRWPEVWKDLEAYFDKAGAKDRELFKDYIPPHKNLGAILIKAYRKIEMNKES